MPDDAEAIRELANTLQKIVEDYVIGQGPFLEFLDKVKATGAPPEVCEDYANQARARIESGQTNPSGARMPPPMDVSDRSSRTLDGNASQPDSGDPAPEARREDTIGRGADKVGEPDETGDTEDAREELRRNELEKEVWNILAGKLGQAFDRRPTHDQELSDASADVFSASILAVAPHLGCLFKKVDDPHLEETFRLRKCFSSEKICEEIAEGVMRQTFEEPLPKIIWKKIIQDRFVAFDKLYGALELGFDSREEPKDVGGGFAIFRKDQFAKKVVRTEAEWLRVFSAWHSAVAFLYPHRRGELQEYKKAVIEMFRAAPRNPSIAISFDAEARERYDKEPFRLDDRNRLHVSVMSQLVAVADGIGSSQGTKRASMFGGPPAKHLDIICDNWNWGNCAEDPCLAGRRHGICSECRGDHRARDVDTCLLRLKTRCEVKRRGRLAASGASKD
jgi:hypothetical protein